MSRQKIIIGTAVAALVGVLAFVAVSRQIGVIILAVGVGGGLILLRSSDDRAERDAEDAEDERDERDARRRKRNRESGGGGRSTSAGTSTLPAWGGLQPWSPPDDDTETEVADETEGDSWAWDNDTWTGDTDEATEVDFDAELERLNDDEFDPFSRLDETETIDEVVEVETEIADDLLVTSPINEEVSSPDDIMAASQATELKLEETENSELARLLAKVQARLAAYE